ncbi:alpha-L-fucosidase 2 [Sphingomonas sp. PP-CE-1A-559]|uniref:glycoside hydrolase family 95 protein n=1 Tax=Sphingomonas sp. PP-CE-1A-559 TaxID=2135657 RepID=UPI001054B426|nr:glycoside hydrolase family 95 protein [Sphingomonas sp. PP-CE-1A-559]TCP93773.1 alpha-L-fucosidase 2 [Sphingomonas sp. PP-CE-1A-559]
MTVEPTRRDMLEGAAAVAVAALAGPGAGPSQAWAAAPADGPRLWYRQPAVAWTEALPVGNGRLGAMVFGGTASERLQLNEDTLWTGGPYDPVNPAAHAALPEVRRLIDAGKFAEAQALANAQVMGLPKTQMAYQPVGDLMLEMPGGSGAVGDYVRQLDLDAAVATTSFTMGGTRFRRDVFASPEDQVIAVHLVGDRPFDLLVGLQSPQLGASVSIDGATVTLAGHNGERAGIAGRLRFVARARVSTVGGVVSNDGNRVRITGARTVTVLVAMATSYRRFDDVSGNPDAATLATLDRASRRGVERIRAETSAAHRALFRRVTLDLGRTAAADKPTDERVRANRAAADPALATLYFDYGRYLLIASSRPGTQPANLQGIWNDAIKPPWESKYTVNINTEMNYWPAEATALAECTAPLVQMVRELAITGERTARTMYGARGWVCHHNTDLWRATAPIDGAQWGLWPTGGAWLCTHLWDRYDYGRDLDYLRSVYPLMRGAALFFLDTLQTDPATGALVTNPSLSPENIHPAGASICAGPAMDMQILRDLFDQVGQAAALLKIDAPFAAEVAAARARLAPDHIGAQGQLQEWQRDWDAAAPEPHHRHVSHLYGLFPSDQIDLDRTPALAQAARRSLELRGDESTGWATAWRANLWARLRDGDHAHRILAFLLGPERTYPNLFDAHPPFQIDGNFGGTRAIAEMLMQSRGDEILLLPALPSAWPAGSVTGLRARGRCSVDLRWREGELVEAVVRSEIPGRRLIRLGTRRVEVVLTPGKAVRLRGNGLVHV